MRFLLTRGCDMLVLALALGVLLIAACYQEPKGVRCSITCDQGETCPNGLSCNAGYCLAQGEAVCVDPAVPIKWNMLAQGDSHRCAISTDGRCIVGVITVLINWA